MLMVLTSLEFHQECVIKASVYFKSLHHANYPRIETCTYLLPTYFVKFLINLI